MNKNISNRTPLFEALSDENRLKILLYVLKRKLKCTLNKSGQCEDQTCIKDLEKHLKISLPTVSYHVKMLVSVGLLKNRKEGRWSYLEVSSVKFKELISFLSLFNNKIIK
jgi:ArsR family transcriptional regulator